MPNAGRKETFWEVQNGFSTAPTREVDIPEPQPLVLPEPTLEPSPLQVPEPVREPELVPA